MSTIKSLMLMAALVCASTGFAAGEGGPGGEATRSLFNLSSLPGSFIAGTEGGADASDDTPAAAPAKGPPLPLHTIEGVGGMTITPMAYLVNPGPKGTQIGMPSFSFTHVQAGSKTVQSFAITQTFFGRFELGYAINRHGIAGLRGAIEKATGGAVDIQRGDTYLHNFNIRMLLLEENSSDLPLPAVTAGLHFKYCHGVRQIDDRTGGLLDMIGFDKSNGLDFTLTATKMFPTLAFGRPVIGTVGMRLSRASHIGYLGFGDDTKASIEGSVVCLVTDWLALGYEFRQKHHQYNRLEHLEGKEGDWHMFSIGWIINNHMTLAAGIGSLGTLHNSHAAPAFALQFKYEL